MPQPSSNAELILVADDVAVNREMLQEMLEREGYRVVCAEDGEQALEGYDVLSAADLKSAFALVESGRPHAVLLDVQLGDEDGLALPAWLRQQPALRHIPVIAVTAHAIVSERDHILQAGCNAWIPKPVDFHSLREHLHRWLPPLSTANSDS